MSQTQRSFFWRFPTSVQLGAILVGTALLSSAAIGWTIYRSLSIDIIEEEARSLSSQARLAAQRLDSELNSMQGDLVFLSHMPPIDGYRRAVLNGGVDPLYGSTQEEWLARLSTIFASMIRAHPEYTQIQLIQIDGTQKEILRVDTPGGQPAGVSRTDLQGAEPGEHVQKAAVLPSGSIFISAIDLTRVNGEISYPIVPIVRASTPAFGTETARPFGVLVITLAIDALFDRAKGDLAADRNLFGILDQGGFAIHPDPTKLYGAELGHGFSAVNQWPALSTDILTKVPGTFRTSPKDHQPVAGGTYRFEYSPGEVITLIVTRPVGHLIAHLEPIRLTLLLVSAAILAAVILLGLIFAEAFARRLRRLRAVASRIAEGDYDMSFATFGGADEVSKLAADLKMMSSNIRERTADLETARNQLRINEERLRLATSGAGIGTWHSDIEHNVLVWSDRSKAIFGLPSSEPMSYERFLEALHIDDRQSTDDLISKALAERKMYKAECRTVWPDGSTHWVLVIGSGYYNDDGEAIRMEGIILDIDDRKVAELALQRANIEIKNHAIRNQSILTSAVDAIITIDSTGVVDAFNPAAKRLFGYSPNQVIGKNVKMLMPEPYRSAHDGYLENYARTGEAKVIGIGREVLGRREDGSTFPVELSVGEMVIAGKRMYTGILRDITDRKEAEQALRAAKQAAEEANLAKSTFLANMSHELRTPLNAIIGYSELLIDESEDLGIETLETDLSKITRAGRHLLSLINDVLDLSKIEAGKIDIELKSFSVSEAIEGIAAVAAPLVADRGNELILECPEAIGEMRSDPTKVRQILFNLLSNAAKFTENGQITLRVDRNITATGDQLTFQVRDTGIGMSANQLDRVFDAFTQAQASTSREYGGTGLGLAISRRYCELLGGTLKVESTLGEGSTFTAHLPAGPGHYVMRNGVTDAAPPGEGPLVLVIDDEASSLDLMTRQLENEGIRVATAQGGEVGLELAETLQPAVIALDVMMSDLDGWSVLEHLKTNPQTADIPVVMCTIVDDEQRGYALGAVDYLIKPVNRERLIDILSKAWCTDPPCRVLVVDDDASIREFLCREATNTGWQVDSAHDGMSALERMGVERPDLILLDLMMPGMDGFEFLETLRSTPEFQETPVVVVTAMDLTTADRARLTGFVDQIIAKGGNEGSLKQSVARVLDAYYQTETNAS